MQQILESLVAFHINAFHSLVFELSNNWWFAFIVLGGISTTIMQWRERRGAIVREEQNIL